ncbi:MAG: hypothetical protein R2942_02700 [Ignavibacteria bacterium]
MKNYLIFKFIIISSLIMIINFTNNSYAQFDDPDTTVRLPSKHRFVFNSTSSIETIDNYDNFFIGIGILRKFMFQWIPMIL